MNMFESSINGERPSFESKNQESEFLSENDIEVINQGLKVLKNYFDKLDPEDLPTKIVFLETSARPLKYAVRPLIVNIYNSKNVSMPKMPFLSAHRDKDLSNYIFDEKFFFELKRYEIEDEIEILTEQAEKYIDDDVFIAENRSKLIENKKTLEVLNEYYNFLDNVEGDDDYYAKRDKKRREILKKLPKEFTDTHNATNALVERVNEVVSSPEDKVLFIDDYVMKGKTFTVISNIVNGSNSRYMWNEFTYFSFFNDTRGGDDERHFPKDEFLFGATSDEEKFKDYYGFKYRYVPRTFDPEKYKRYKQENERHIGVRKSLGKKYIELSPNADNMQVKALKEQMANIGKEFVEKNT